MIFLKLSLSSESLPKKIKQEVVVVCQDRIRRMLRRWIYGSFSARRDEWTKIHLS